MVINLGRSRFDERSTQNYSKNSSSSHRPTPQCQLETRPQILKASSKPSDKIMNQKAGYNTKGVRGTATVTKPSTLKLTDFTEKTIQQSNKKQFEQLMTAGSCYQSQNTIMQAASYKPVTTSTNQQAKLVLSTKIHQTEHIKPFTTKAAVLPKRLTAIKQNSADNKRNTRTVEAEDVVEQTKVNGHPAIIQQQQQQKEFRYYDTGVKIGNGKFGPVSLIIHEGKLYANKVVPKASIDTGKRIEHVKNEKQILQRLRRYNQSAVTPSDSGADGVGSRMIVSRGSNRSGNKGENNGPTEAHYKISKGVTLLEADKVIQPLDFIVMLFQTFVDEYNVNFVFEYLPGQDLFWILGNENTLGLGPTQQRRKNWVLFYCAEILLALENLHSRQIIYRDMKPENVMVDSDGHIKLIDFGFAKQLDARTNFRTRTNCGTIGYTAPEILLGLTQGYSFPVDIWSFGIFIAEMLSGSLPFLDKDDPMKLQEQIVAGQLKLNKEGIEVTTRDCLNQIFKQDPEMRPSIDHLKHHRLFMKDKPVDYWQQVASKTFGEVPYKPNPLKYSYLLQNEYPVSSNIQTRMTQGGPSKQKSQSLLSLDPVISVKQPGHSTAANTQLRAMTIQETKMSSIIPPTAAAATFKKQKRPTNVERNQNVGMFGQGGGNFDTRGNIKKSMFGVDIHAQGGSSTLRKKATHLLGDFTLYRVNKEFENF